MADEDKPKGDEKTPTDTITMNKDDLLAVLATQKQEAETSAAEELKKQLKPAEEKNIHAVPAEVKKRIGWTKSAVRFDGSLDRSHADSVKSSMQFTDWIGAALFGPLLGPNQLWTPRMAQTEEGKALAAMNYAQFKALSEATQGGSLVPVEFIPELRAIMFEASEVLPFVHKRSVSANTGTLPRRTANPSMTWGTAENSAVTASDPTYSNYAYVARNAEARTEISNDLTEDSAIDIIGDVKTTLAGIAGEDLDRVICIGNNSSSEPIGIFSSSSVSAVAVSGAMTYAKLTTMLFGVTKRYRSRNKPSVRFVMNETVLEYITRTVDSDGKPIFVPDPTGGIADKMFGFPISTNSNCPVGLMAFGDLDYYELPMLKDITLSSNAEGKYWEKNQISTKVRMRVAGDVILTHSSFGPIRKSGVFTAPE